MAIFIKFPAITSMRSVIDYLDTIVFSSTGTDLFALFISVVWLSQLCIVCCCTPRSGMFSCRYWGTLDPVGPPEVHWAFIIVLVVEGCGSSTRWFETPLFPVMLPTSEKHRSNFLCTICITLHLGC